MFENPRRGRQARYVTTHAPKILDLKSSSEQRFSQLKLPLGAPDLMCLYVLDVTLAIEKCLYRGTISPCTAPESCVDSNLRFLGISLP